MRIECIYNNEMLYIADYCTPVQDKKIVKQGEIEQLRALGRSGQLYCSCPCGGKLTLVVPKNPCRTPFFRLQKGQNVLCTAREETEQSIHSKVILKHWLDDALKLNKKEVQYNVPINQLGEIERRYQYSHYVPSRRIGICYERIESNVCDEKIKAVTAQENITSLFIVDKDTYSFQGQYPEFALKIQNAQEYYAILLCGVESLYRDAKLKIVHYETTQQKPWAELAVCTGALSSYSFDSNGRLCFEGKTVLDLVKECRGKYINDNTSKQVEGTLIKRSERPYKNMHQSVRREFKTEIPSVTHNQEINLDLVKRLNAREITPNDVAQYGFDVCEGEFSGNVFITMTRDFEQDQCIVVNEKFHRLVKCEKCGKVKRDIEFYVFGGKSRTKGICENCRHL